MAKSAKPWYKFVTDLCAEVYRLHQAVTDILFIFVVSLAERQHFK